MATATGDAGEKEDVSMVRDSETDRLEGAKDLITGNHMGKEYNEHVATIRQARIRDLQSQLAAAERKIEAIRDWLNEDKKFDSSPYDVDKFSAECGYQIAQDDVESILQRG